MPKSGPIIIVEDDSDDQELLTEIFQELNLPNAVRYFNSCLNALDYLLTTIEKPFLIISDINLPAMTGLEFCRKVTENNYLRKKSIPFIFLTTTPEQKVISAAYEMYVHGFFVKPSSVEELRDMMRMILGYWQFSKHPCA